MKNLTLLVVASLLLSGCAGSSKNGSIWGDSEDRGITGVWSKESEKPCETYGNCGGGSVWGSGSEE